MRLVRFLPQRFRGLADELVKFATVGLINTGLDYLVLNLLLSIGPLKAKVAATVVATTASYLMNRRWTFADRSRTGVRREYVLFFTLNLVGMVIQLAVLGVAKYGMGFSEHGGVDDRLALNLANAVGIAVAMVFRFWAYRTFVFTAPETPVTEMEAIEVALTDVALTELHELDATGPATPGQRSPLDAQRSSLDSQRSPLDSQRSPLDAQRSSLDAEFDEMTAQLEADLREEAPR